jgi:hypothetical protein
VLHSFNKEGEQQKDEDRQADVQQIVHRHS